MRYRGAIRSTTTSGLITSNIIIVDIEIGARRRAVTLTYPNEVPIVEQRSGARAQQQNETTRRSVTNTRAMLWPFYFRGMPV